MKNNLFDLIHSLSRNEKGYFKKYSLKHSPDTDNNYVKLFNAIEKQKVSDDDKLDKKFRKETFVGQLHVTKNYLYKQILKSLESFHYTTFETKRLLMQAKLLSAKYLFAQSWEIANKVLDISQRQEDFTTQLEVLDIRLDLMQQSSFAKTGQEHIHAIYKQKQIVLDKLANLNEFQFLRYQVSVLSVKTEKQSGNEQFDQIIKNDLLQDEKRAKSFTSKVIFYQLNAYCAHFIKRNLQESSKYLEKQLALFEDEPNKKQFFRKQYLNCLSSLLLLFKDLRDEKRFFATLSTFKEYGRINDKPDPSVFSKSLTIETDFRIQTANPENIDAIYNEIKNGLKEMGDKITPVKKKILLYNCAYLFFMNSNYRQSLRLINNIITDHDLSMRRDITLHTYWLQLQVFYEQDSFGLLAKQCLIIEKYILDKRALTANESLLLDFFKKNIFPIADKRAEKKYFLSLKGSFTEEKINTFQSEGIDLLSWIDAKVFGKTFIEVYSKKMLHD